MANHLPEQVKQSIDIAAIGAAGTINVAQLNEIVTLTAGLLAILWSLIRLYEWAQAKRWHRRRSD